MKAPMSWLFLSNMYPSANDPSYGAFVSRSLADLRARGIDIAHAVVIEGRHSGRRKLVRYLGYFRRMLAVGIFGRVDAIYAHYASHHCLPIAFMAIVLRKRLVLHIHGDDLAVRRGFSRTLNRTGQGLLVRHAKLIVVPSGYFAELLGEIYPQVPKDRIFVSPSSGVDTEAYATRPPGARLPYWEAPHGPETVAHFGFVGRIEADKGWRLITDSYASLPPHLASRIKLHFWGSGQEVPALKAEIDRIGPHHASYHGHVAPEEVPAIHRLFDFHLIPSYRESLGLSAIEGLAVGHVVLCSDIRPFTDFTVDGQNALHFKAGDVASLCSAIIRALSMTDTELQLVASAARHSALAYDRQLVSLQLSEEIASKVCRS